MMENSSFYMQSDDVSRLIGEVTNGLGDLISGAQLYLDK